MDVNPRAARPAVRALYLSERDLASMWGLSVKTLQGWRLRRKGPPWRRLCGTVRYDVEALEAWVAAQPGGGAAA